MTSKIVNHRDISIKFAYKTLGEVIHNYFNLDGKYLGLKDNEVVTMYGENLRKDISYQRSGQITNSMELQNYPVDMNKLGKISEYVIDVLRNDDQQLADSIILTSVDPKYCEKMIKLTETLILEPMYIYISPDKVMKMFNNIENKVLNNLILSYREEVEFIIVAIFVPNNKKEEITSKLCELFGEYSKIMDYKVSLKISFVLWMMIERNIKQKAKKEELIKVIDMEEKIDSLQELINEEKVKKEKELRKANTELKNFKIKTREQENKLKEQTAELKEQNSQLKEKDAELKEQNSQLKEKDAELKEKDDIIKKLSNALLKSKIMSQKTLISITTPKYEE